MHFHCPYIYLCLFFLACTYFVPLLLLPPVSVFHLFRDFLFSVRILVQFPFLEVLVEAISPPLSSQQGSSINKKAAPCCTIMAKNKLPSLRLPSCFHSFNTNYLVLLCACMLIQLCACLPDCVQVCLTMLRYYCSLSLQYLYPHLHVFFLMCFILSGSIASVWMPLPSV